MSKLEMEPKQDLVADSPDGFGLGRSQGQRSAEVVAAVRAIKMPSIETEAMSRFAGRIFLRLLTSVLGKSAEAALNFVPVRTNGIKNLSIEELEGKEDPIFVEVAGGFSPRALWLAREQADIQVIEIDQQFVIDEKQRRLRSKHVEVPENLEWIVADLAREPLKQVLNNRMANVIVAEGLNVYFTPEEVTQIAQGIFNCLKPGGSYISSIGWRKGLDETAKVNSMFIRQAGQWLSIMKTREEAEQLFLNAGFETATVHTLQELAEQYEMNEYKPVFDNEIVVHARKAGGGQESSTTSAEKPVVKTNPENAGKTENKAGFDTNITTTSTEDTSSTENGDS